MVCFGQVLRGIKSEKNISSHYFQHMPVIFFSSPDRCTEIFIHIGWLKGYHQTCCPIFISRETFSYSFLLKLSKLSKDKRFEMWRLQKVQSSFRKHVHRSNTIHWEIKLKQKGGGNPSKLQLNRTFLKENCSFKD